MGGREFRAANQLSETGQRLLIRPLEPGDISAALAIQSQAYPAFLREDEAAFASRIAIKASYCLAATRDGELVAYLLAHGWLGLAPPPVGAILPAEAPSDILFIHDLAVSPQGRGSGIGRDLVARAFELATRDGLDTAELIAVEGAAPYWASLGFEPVDCSAELAAKVAAYGPQACLMKREFGSVRSN